MQDDSRIEDTQKFMALLMEVKEEQAKTNVKLQQLVDLKTRVDKIDEMATESSYRSDHNKTAINKMSGALSAKASKEDVDEIVKRRESTFKHLPAWLALGLTMIMIVLNIINLI